MVATVVMLCFMVGFMVLMFVWMYHRTRKMSKAGFEYLRIVGSGPGKGSGCNFYMKNGTVYYNTGINPDKARPIEVIDVSEITQNSYLVELEVRFRMDGALRTDRIKGTPNQLLPIKERLVSAIGFR